MGGDVGAESHCHPCLLPCSFRRVGQVGVGGRVGAHGALVRPLATGVGARAHLLPASRGGFPSDWYVQGRVGFETWVENSKPTSRLTVFVSFEFWGNHVSSVCSHCYSGTSSSPSEGRDSHEADPGASAGTEATASEVPEGESEAPEDEGPAEPGTDSWLIALFVFFFPFGLLGIRLFRRVCTITF